MKWTEIETELLKNNIEKSLFRNRFSIYKKLKKLNLYDKYLEFTNSRIEEREDGRRKKISATCKINKKSGGYRKGSGRGKKGTYKGYWCDSSYELAWVIFHIEHNIEFIRNTEKFPYYFNNELKNYIPDFIIGDTYFEIKGYKDEKVDSKIEYFPFKLKLLYLEDMKEIFDYVIENYGKNFISLYEEKINNNCIKCDKILQLRSKRNKTKYCLDCYNITIKVDKKMDCSCGKKMDKRSIKCLECIKKEQYDKKPKLEVLLKDVDELGYCGTGRKYGVSDNTIRKWIKSIIKYENQKQDIT